MRAQHGHKAKKLMPWLGVIVVLVMVGQFSLGSGQAHGPNPSLATSACNARVTAIPTANNSGSSSSQGLCNVAGPSFLATSWSGSWVTVEKLIQPCGGNGFVTYPGNAPFTSNGSIPSYTKAYVNGDNYCSYVRDVAKVNLGLWGQGFDAWKPGYAIYTVMANFTVTDSVSAANYASQYCGSCGSSDVTTASITANDAVYDDSTSSGVGAAVQQTIQNVTAYGANNLVQNHNYSNTFSVAFTTSQVLYGNTLVPRASVIVYAWAYLTSSWPYASHDSATTETIVSGTPLVLVSIWVS